MVAPDGNQHFSFGFAATTTAWVHFTSGKGVPVPDLGENGGYVGLPLLALLLAGGYRFRRDRLVRFAAVMAVIALVLSMGATLNVAGHSLGVPLPFRLLTKLPLLQDEVPSRYSVAMWLFIALLAAAVLDRAWQHWKAFSQREMSLGRPLRHRRKAKLAAGAIAGTWAVLVVVSLIPSWPYPWSSDAVPAWFTSPAVHEVPYGSTLVTYPMARSPYTYPDVWQAVAGMWYRTPAGQGVFAHPGRSATETVFDDCLFDGQAPPLTAKILEKMRKDLRTFDVSTVVVPSTVPFAACGASVMDVVLGRQPVHQYGASVWTRVPSLLAVETSQAVASVAKPVGRRHPVTARESARRPGRHPVLVTGASGYVGGRLVPALLDSGCEVRCLARTPAKLDDAPWRARVEVVAGSVGGDLTDALAGVDVAVYLVHSIGQGSGWATVEQDDAKNFARFAAQVGLRRIVYLGGLGRDSDRLSAHLRSRHVVGEALASTGVEVVELRAGVVIGSGSASFEMLRYLVEVLPIMVTPRWVTTRCQPIAITDILELLVQAVIDADVPAGVYEVGGPDVVSYAEMMALYARAAGLTVAA